MNINKKGFTLGELLIAVAIVSILVGVGMPTFINQLELKREAADLSAVRDAYGEVMIAGMDEDEEFTYSNSNEVIYKQNGIYQATYKPLSQTKDGWQPDTILKVGDITPDDEIHWIGSPVENGKCIITYLSNNEEMFVEWVDSNGASSIVMPSDDEFDDEGTYVPVPEKDKLHSLLNKNGTHYPNGTFIGTTGNVYKFEGVNYVCTYGQQFSAGGSPLTWYQAQFIAITDQNRRLTEEDIITEQWGATRLSIERGDIYEENGKYYICISPNSWGNKPSVRMDDWLEINLKK